MFTVLKRLVKSLLSLAFVRPPIDFSWVLGVILERKFIAASFWNCFSYSHPQNDKGLFINQLSLKRLISSFLVSFSPFFFYLFSSLRTLPQAFACSLIFSIFIKQKIHTHSYIFQGEIQTFSEMMRNLCPVLIAITNGTDTQLYSIRVYSQSLCQAQIQCWH